MSEFFRNTSQRDHSGSLFSAFFKWQISPITKKRLHSFRTNRRGYWSFWIFIVLFILSLFAELITNDKPLMVSYKNKIYYPVIKIYPETTFGKNFLTEAEYREKDVQLLIEKKNNWILWAPIKYNYRTINFRLQVPTPSPPSWENLLKTDDQTKNVLARIIYGFRVCVIFGLVLTILSSVVGIFADTIQGFFGGWTDLLFQRFIEMWSNMPRLFLLIILTNVFQPSFWMLLILLLLFEWITLEKVVRAEFLRTRNFDYVHTTRSLGVDNSTIIRRHVLPNAMTAALTFLPFILIGSITTLTSLDFLGFGLPPNSPSLNELLTQGKANLQAPWLDVTAFLVLSIMLSLLVFIGETIRDAFDPRKTS